MRTSDLDRKMEDYFYGVMLAGMPEGTFMGHEVVWSLTEDVYWLKVWIVTGENITKEGLRLDPHELYNAAAVVGKINEFMRSVQRTHWLATFNIWPGWRL